MSEPEWKPDVDADAALALIQAENDYRSALVGPVSPDALSLLQASPPMNRKPERPGSMPVASRIARTPTA